MIVFYQEERKRGIPTRVEKLAELHSLASVVVQKTKESENHHKEKEKEREGLETKTERREREYHCSRWRCDADRSLNQLLLSQPKPE